MNKNNLPNHIGIIMDGNRRWAKANNMKAFSGHKKGTEVFEEIATHAFDLGIKYISIYAFSTDNWSREENEINYLMKLFIELANKKIEKIMKKGAKVVFLGNMLDKRLPDSVKESFKITEEKSKDNTEGTLAICINYGGHEEITAAVKKIIENGIKANDITPELISQNIYKPEVPPIDLLIRTSGEQRISNYMLWRIAYSEFVFVKKHWPDFTKRDFDLAIEKFQRRTRRFGGN